MGKFLTVQGGYHRYDIVTFMRGFSILTIVLMHLMQVYMVYLPQWVLKAASLGGTGVHVFFLCSGFGLYLSYRHKELRYFEFLKIRFLKVYIPYVLIVVLCFLIPVIKVEGDRLVALLSHVSLLKMFMPQYDESFGPYWFISALFQFYFLFVPLCYAKKRLGTNLFFICSLVLSVLWWILTTVLVINEIRIWGSFFLQYLWEFSLGIVIADKLFEETGEIKIRNSVLAIITVFGIAMEGILGTIGGPLKAFNDIPALFGYTALGLIIWQIICINKPICFFGEISYEWYLVHMLVFAIICGIISGYLGAIIALTMSVLLAYGYHILLNRTIYRIQLYEGLPHGTDDIHEYSD